MQDQKKSEKYALEFNSYTSWNDGATCFWNLIGLVNTFIVNFFLPQYDTN
jgi:hypothetical protein